MSLCGIISVLQDSLEEERVLGDALHGDNKDINQTQTVTITLRLTPLKDSIFKIIFTIEK